MSEKPFPSLFCHAGCGRGLCLCCPQLSWVMLALNTHHAEHPQSLSFFWKLSSLPLSPSISFATDTWRVKGHMEQWLRGVLGFTRHSQHNKLSLSIALKGTWLSGEFRGMWSMGVPLGCHVPLARWVGQNTPSRGFLGEKPAGRRGGSFPKGCAHCCCRCPLLKGL